MYSHQHMHKYYHYYHDFYINSIYIIIIMRNIIIRELLVHIFELMYLPYFATFKISSTLFAIYKCTHTHTHYGM